MIWENVITLYAIVRWISIASKEVSSVGVKRQCYPRLINTIKSIGLRRGHGHSKEKQRRVTIRLFIIALGQSALLITALRRPVMSPPDTVTEPGSCQ